jgi:hypothetical protein
MIAIKTPEDFLDLLETIIIQLGLSEKHTLEARWVIRNQIMPTIGGSNVIH